MGRYTIGVATYIGQKSIFSHLIKWKQLLVKRLPKHIAIASHSEMVFFHPPKWLTNKCKDITYSNSAIDVCSGDIYEDMESLGLSFSSSEVDDGIRFKIIYRHPERWILHTIQVSKEEYEEMFQYALDREGGKYNWFGIVFKQTLGTSWFRRENDKFCSEIVTELLQFLHITCGKGINEVSLCRTSAIELSPGMLLNILSKLQKHDRFIL